MSIEGQGHFFTIYFPGFVCFVLYYAKISGERLQDHWSSGLIIFESICGVQCYREDFCLMFVSFLSIQMYTYICLRMFSKDTLFLYGRHTCDKKYQSLQLLVDGNIFRIV